MEQEKITPRERKGLKVIRVDKKYLVLVSVPKWVKEENIQSFINKIELDLKVFGIKNVKAIPHVAGLIEILEKEM